MTMLRYFHRGFPRVSALARHHQSKPFGLKAFATQSGDDAGPPTALAKLYLEDGTTFTGLSFGSHTSVEGEVRFSLVCVMQEDSFFGSDT
jgi:hypothetical protein